MKDFNDPFDEESLLLDEPHQVTESRLDHDLVELQTDLEGMHARIIQLVFGLFEKGYISNAFNIGFTQHPTIRYLERLRRLLLLETLTDRLLNEILPRIIRKLSSQHHRHIEIHTDRIQGSIDPVRTHQLNPLSLMVSATFATRHHTRDFLTPENLLIGLTINNLIHDVHQLLHDHTFMHKINMQERKILESCAERCQRIKRHSLIVRICQEAHHISQAANLLEETEGKAQRNISINTRGIQDSYRQLVEWRDQYKHLDITLGDMTDKAPSRPVSHDQGYELLVMLEILLLLGHFGMVRQLRPLSVRDRRSSDPVFECVFSQDEKWDIYYQTSAPLQSHRYVRHLSGIPDLLILNPGSDRLLICDAKKYTVTSYGGAFFKMLGYLYQFGYPDGFDRVAGGVLFIPGRIGQEPGWTEWAGGSDNKQSITTLTIPISGLADRKDQKECFTWVQKARQQLSGKRLG